MMSYAYQQYQIFRLVQARMEEEVMKKGKKRRRKMKSVEMHVEPERICPNCGRPLDDDEIEGCAMCNGGDNVLIDWSVDDFIDVP